MLTTDFDVAYEWALELYGSPNFLEFWFPRHHFLQAERGQHWMSASRIDKDKRYGMAIGAGARFNSDWNHFSISRFADQSQIDLNTFKHDGGWIAYVIETKAFAHLEPLENMNDAQGWKELESFLESHFDDASTKPGNPEVLSWTVLRDNDKKIIAAGALSEWESGGLAANSIAVDTSLRGQGIGKTFVERMIASGFALGYSSMCLGVYDQNIAGIKLYESVGFTKVDEFFHYTEVEDNEKRRNRPLPD